MKIFIGSSKESENLMKEIAIVLEANGVEPLKWNKPGLFIPGTSVIDTIMKLSKEVDGAIFIYAEDDKSWYREAEVGTPRDNVVLEHGIFTGALSNYKRTALIKHKNPKIPTDYSGIVYIDYSEERKNLAQFQLETWLNTIKSDINNNQDSLRENENSLNLYLAKVKKENSIDFFLSNDVRNIKLQNFNNDDSFYHRQYQNFFTIFPTTKNEFEFPLSFYFESELPSGITMEEFCNDEHFDVKIEIGEHTFSKSHFKVTSTNHQNKIYYQITLQTKNLSLIGQTNCVIALKSIVPNNVQIETFAARYPTKGFSLRLEYDERHTYEYNWFKTNAYIEKDKFNMERADMRLNNGFHTYLNDWMLIGEGIAVCWT
jgi:hypothetical protein